MDELGLGFGRFTDFLADGWRSAGRLYSLMIIELGL